MLGIVRSIVLGFMLLATTRCTGEARALFEPDASLDASVEFDAGLDASTDTDVDAADAGPLTDAAVDAGVADAGLDNHDAGCVTAPWQPTGVTRDLRPGASLASALALSAPGDRVLVHAGHYPSETLTQGFADFVLIEAAQAETPVFSGLKLTAAHHLVIRGMTFDDTVTLQGAHHVRFEHIALTIAVAETTGLEINGQNAQGPNHDLSVTDSILSGGGRTVFILGRFAPSSTWNSALVFERNDFSCGNHNCFQISGGRDVRIEDNVFHDPRGAAVLTAGATHVQLLRNVMRGSSSVGAAIAIATPGYEWDAFTGVENMISSDVLISNNLIWGWGGPGIILQASTDVRIVNNTIQNTTGVLTQHRIPHSPTGAVVLEGNSNYQLWNNVLTTVSIDAQDPRPMFESNNLVRSGGAGVNLITSAPLFVDTIEYELSAQSPAINSAVLRDETPLVDLKGRLRDALPDRGALEVNATPQCR